MTPFDAFKTYLAVKTHFTRDGYDYFKYSGKVAAHQPSFENRRDRFRFEKLAKMDDPTMFLASSIARDHGAWIGDLLQGDAAKDNYTETVRFIEAFSYEFKKDLKKLPGEGFVDNLQGDQPALLTALRSGNISLETVALLDSKMGFTRDWMNLQGLHRADPAVALVIRRVQKYSPFISSKINSTTMIKILREVYA